VKVTLPTARVGLVTAVILGIARVAGETAPVLFTAGGSSRYNWNPFVGRQDDLPLRVYEMIFQPGINATRDAWGVAFVLVLVVLTLFVLARLVGSRTPGRRRVVTLFRALRRSALGSQP
jgi:phosphate transport system permease protein